MKKVNVSSFYSTMMLGIFVFMLMAGLLFDLNVYSKLNNSKNISEDLHLPYSYVLTKLRNSNDVIVEDNRIYLNDEGVKTCIYFYDGYLWEISYYDGFKFKETDGERICQADEFEVSEIDKKIVMEYSFKGINKKLVKKVSDE